MNNLWVKISDRKDALKSRFRRWLDERTFRPHKLRGVLIGCILTIVLCEVACYRMLQSIARFGDLAEQVPDMMIVVMALLEAMVSPFVSWFGYWRRRTIMLVVMPVLVLITVSWLFLPDVQHTEESELCQATINQAAGISQSSSIRFIFVLGSCLVFLLARVAVWCHGFAYIEEHAPERVSVHLGVLIFVRTVSLAADYHMIGIAVKTSQIISFIVNFSIQILQMLIFLPSGTSQEQEAVKRTEDRSFFVSIWRVLSNPLALTQMVSLGLLAAAVWGFGYQSTDIIKAKYLMNQKSGLIDFFTEAFQCYGILMAVLYVGLKWSVPIQVEFCKLRAVKQSLTMCILVGLLLTILAVTMTCERGNVAGLEGLEYTSPGCSDQCGCSNGWTEFSPVCVVEDMKTYLSPCHAGCAGVDTQGGLLVYANCSCAPSGFALGVACSEGSCRPVRALHRSLYVLLLTFTVLAFHSHYVLVLKTADARDKSVALGLAGSAVCLAAFVFGHLAFNSINASTCIWFSKRCHLNSPELPRQVGLTGAALAACSAVICLVSYVWLKVEGRKRLRVTRL